MPKPTLLQSLFNQPTQSYSNIYPQQQRVKRRIEEYHSVRSDMLRLAAKQAEPVPPPSYASPPVPLPVLSPRPSSPPSEHDPLSQSETENGDEDNDEDTFFTPTTSPRNSCAEQDSNTLPMGAQLVLLPTLLSTMHANSDNAVGAKVNANVILNDKDDDHDEATPHPDAATAKPEVLRRMSATSVVSLSTTSLDGSVSEASWPTSFSAPSTSSTRVTTPTTSEGGHTGTGTGTGSRCPSTRSNSLRRRKAENRRSSTTYTDDDWAKDVRWLVVPTVTTTTQQQQASSSDKRKSWHSVSRAATTPVPTSANTKRRSARQRFDIDPMSMSVVPALPNVPMQMRPPQRRTASQSTANSRRSTMGRRRMSAVWEEDEGDEPAPNSPRRVHTDPASLSSLGRSRSLSSQRPAERARSPTSTSLLSGESGSIGCSSAACSAFTSTSRTVDLPNPLPATDGGTPSGFTSLVLPRAAYTPATHKRYSLRFGSSSHVDITRSGLAQTTMSTVSITKNASADTASSALGRGPRPRFLSLSSLHVSGSETSKKAKLPKTPSHLLGTLPRPLSFTSHTPPPSKVNSHQILVQVYAVALDGLDDRIVSEKAARKDCYGFVPGRSFVGRAVEVGFEVNSIAKSDWVIGLLDVRKCGALAEFVIVEKRRITRCPRPSAALSLEQLALLPLCGVPAHRAVRTAGVDADTERGTVSARALVLQGHDGTGALAVQALVYAGMHVTAHIPHHADTPRIRTPSTSSTRSSSDDSEPLGSGSGSGSHEHSSTREAEERVRRWGARGVRVGDAAEVVENCDPGAFDVVIDTVGGRRIWDACQRVLTTSGQGQFTTLVGDVSTSPSPSPSPSPSDSHSPFHFYSHSKSRSNSNSNSHSRSNSNSNSCSPESGRAIPSMNAHFRANFRSIRRALRAKKTIGYALVSPAADVDHFGEDVRDSLVEVVRRAVAGVFVPFVPFGANGAGADAGAGAVLPFERAPELFGSGALSEGRTGVVRVVD